MRICMMFSKNSFRNLMISLLITGSMGAVTTGLAMDIDDDRGIIIENNFRKPLYVSVVVRYNDKGNTKYFDREVSIPAISPGHRSNIKSSLINTLARIGTELDAQKKSISLPEYSIVTDDVPLNGGTTL